MDTNAIQEDGEVHRTSLEAAGYVFPAPITSNAATTSTAVPAPNAAATINDVGPNGTTPLLHLCLASHEDVQAVQSLLDAGADPTTAVALPFEKSKVVREVTPLYAASHSGHAAVVAVLLGEPNVLAELHEEWSGHVMNETALFAAARQGHSSVVRLLAAESTKEGLNCSKDLNTAAGDSTSPLIVASSNGHACVVRTLLGQPEVDVNLRPHDNTALTAACRCRHVDVVRLLLAHPQIDVNLGLDPALLPRDFRWRLPLVIASLANCSGAVRELLKHADIDVNADGSDVRRRHAADTALHAAAKFGHHDIVLVLLADANIDVNKAGYGVPDTPVEHVNWDTYAWTDECQWSKQTKTPKQPRICSRTLMGCSDPISVISGRQPAACYLC